MEVQAQTIKPMALATPANSANSSTPLRNMPASATEKPQAVEEKTPAEPAAISDVQLKGAIDAANEYIKPINSAVKFSMDKDSGSTVVKVLDTETKEVIRQIPSEEMLAIAKALNHIQGLLIKQKA